jgi:hypothetical protein
MHNQTSIGPAHSFRTCDFVGASDLNIAEEVWKTTHIIVAACNFMSTKFLSAMHTAAIID